MAIQILNSMKKNGFGHLIGKYEHFAHEIQEALEENKKALNKLKKATEEAVSDGTEGVKDAVMEAHRSVKKNPWLYISAASAGALLLGFILGKRK